MRLKYLNHYAASRSIWGRHARIIRELPRQRATDSFVMSDASATPGSADVAAAQTSEKRRSQRRDRSSQTPMDVTASGTNFRSNPMASAANSGAYFSTFLL